ncbi:MAG: M48 family metallopeptidase [Candidatus Lambdaproteobacteria bacterium]|nr:M48 family metallopeptidase [Candidatus Lambdaproteobacteria bacterium]
MEAALDLGGNRVAYRIRLSRGRRTLALSIDPEQGLVVHAPARVEPARVEALLREKARWILRQLARLEAARVERRAPAWLPELPVPYRGGQLTLRLEATAGSPEVQPAADALIVRLPPLEALDPEPGRIQALVLAWYREEARRVIDERLARFRPLIGVEPVQVRVKEQRRRWGTCTARGALYFNWRLVLAPPEVLDYVVVHELCHLRVLNHSPEFWRLVAEVLPDHRERRRGLRAFGEALAL